MAYTCYYILNSESRFCGNAITNKTWDEDDQAYWFDAFCPEHMRMMMPITQTTVAPVYGKISAGYIALSDGEKTVKIYDDGIVTQRRSCESPDCKIDIFDLDDILRSNSSLDGEAWTTYSDGTTKLRLLTAKLIADRICEFIRIDRKVQLIKDIRELVQK